MYGWNEIEERERYPGNGGREKKGERGRWSVFERKKWRQEKRWFEGWRNVPCINLQCSN